MQDWELTDKQRKAWLFADVWQKRHAVAAQYCGVRSVPSFRKLLARARMNIARMEQFCLAVGCDPEKFHELLKRDALFPVTPVNPVHPKARMGMDRRAAVA